MISLKTRELVDTYPLSPTQQGLLFNALAAPGAGVDIEQIVCTLPEALHRPALGQAWQRLVDRHAVLRTAMCWEGQAEPVQQVYGCVTCPLDDIDWRDLENAEQTARLEAYLQQDRRRGFDLTKAPLMRLALFRQAEASYTLVWTFHHILLDGRSFPALLQEVFAHYAALCEGGELRLEPPRPYRDYIDWLNAQDFSPAEAFWRSALEGVSRPTRLTALERAPLGPAGALHAEACLELSPALTADLRALAAQRQLTLNALLQAAWALWLGRQTGEDEVVFGVTRSCRRSALGGKGAETMAGLLINTLPMRLRLPAEARVGDWLQAVRGQTLALRGTLAEHASLMSVQGWSQVPAGMPLFETLVIFENYQLDAALQALGGAWAARHVRLVEQTNFPLVLAAYDGPRLLLKLEYDPCRFAPEAVSGWLGQLQTLLAEFLAGADQPLNSLTLLSPAEQQALQAERAGPRVALQPGGCGHAWFAAQVERTPDAPAVIGPTQTLTYAELNRRAGRLAGYLRGLGVGPERLVGICLERSPDLIVAALGILKAGGAYVPIDPGWPTVRKAFILADTQASVVVTHSRWQAEFESAGNGTSLLCMDEAWPPVPARSGPMTPATPENLAYLIYTSGTSGAPKAVMVDHAALANFTAWAAETYALGPGDRVLQFASFSFDAAAEEIYPCLARGGALVLRTDAMLATAPAFLQACRAADITVLDLPTAYWHTLVAGLAAVAPTDWPPRLRLVILGGERALPGAVERWRAAAPPEVRLVNTYGPTETTVVATLADLGSWTAAEGEVPIGRPIWNAEVQIVDGAGQMAPPGLRGQLIITGRGLARGYWRRPDLSAEKFPTLAVGPGPARRWYLTGDLARCLSGGQLVFCGRVDQQVKVRGYRVEPGEIEAALGRHPAVRTAAVVARDLGKGETQLVAYVVLHASSPAAPDEAVLAQLREALSAELPGYMVPAVFVPLAALPLNSSGKVDRAALPAPEPGCGLAASGEARPRTPVEAAVAAVWAEVLGVATVGIESDFFELGGQSLRAIQIISRLREVFQVEVPLSSLLGKNATVARQAQLVEAARAGQAEPLEEGVL